MHLGGVSPRSLHTTVSMRRYAAIGRGISAVPFN
jgi:hypothetical protein